MFHEARESSFWLSQQEIDYLKNVKKYITIYVLLSGFRNNNGPGMDPQDSANGLLIIMPTHEK